MDNEIQVTVTSDDSQGFTVGEGTEGVVPHEEVVESVESQPTVSKSRAPRAERLRKENALLRQQNEELAAMLRERDHYLQAQREELLKQTREAEEREVEAAEQTLAEREKTILGQMKYAKEEGLVDDEVLLTRELSKIQADRSALDLLSGMKEEETYFKPEPYVRPEVSQPTAPDFSEEFLDYLERHPELNPQHRLFDSEKLARAEEIARDLTSILHKQGDGSLVGTSMFYNVIDDALSKSSRREEPATLGVSRGKVAADPAYSISKGELSFIRRLPVYLDDGTEASEEQKIQRYLKAGENIKHTQTGSTRVL